MKQGLLTRDWFVGLLVAITVLALGYIGVFSGIERSAYDVGVRYSSNIPSDKIAIVAIDDVSIANIGRWPWSRDNHAKMHELLKRGGAKVIGQTTFFIEPQLDPGLKHIKALIEFYASSSLSSKLNDDKLDTDLSLLGEKLMQAEIELNPDHILAQSLEDTENVVLAMHFTIGQPLGRPDTDLPDYVQRNRLQNVDSSTFPGNLYPLLAAESLIPITEIGAVADAIGPLIAFPDVDGGIRAEPLIIDYFGDYYPSQSLLIAARSLNLGPRDIRITRTGVQLGKLNIRTDDMLRMNTFFYSSHDGNPVFPVDSFYDVLMGKIPANKYKGKIVLIGATATGVGDSMVTPVNSNMAPVLTLAHSISSILNEDFFIEPEWSVQARAGVIVVLVLYILFLLPRLKAGSSSIITFFLLAGLAAAHFVLMTQYSMWLQLMTPAILLIAGHATITTKRYLLTESDKAQLDVESAETNRMLGLSLQGQGQLDAAFEKFRRLTPNKESLELLYNLALDFERKRQFNKAGSVYANIQERDPKFRDIRQRLKRSQAMEETVILGGGSFGPGGTLVLNREGIEKPMLGRYQIEKEIGKGAMGAVYLGKDPKISRVVAIKTMALSQEFETTTHPSARQNSAL